MQRHTTTLIVTLLLGAIVCSKAQADLFGTSPPPKKADLSKIPPLNPSLILPFAPPGTSGGSGKNGKGSEPTGSGKSPKSESTPGAAGTGDPKDESGGSSGSGASGGVIDAKRRNIAKINASLLEHLKRRELARWKYEHGGASEGDLSDLRYHDERIHKLQQARYRDAMAIRDARLKDAKSEADRARIRKSWDKFHRMATANYGLKSPKFRYADQNYNIPSDPRELACWLATPY